MVHGLGHLYVGHAGLALAIPVLFTLSYGLLAWLAAVGMARGAGFLVSYLLLRVVFTVLAPLDSVRRARSTSGDYVRRPYQSLPVYLLFWLGSCGASLSGVYATRNMIAEPLTLSTPSMSPTLLPGDHVIVSRPPQDVTELRSQLALVRYRQGYVYLERVVGLPGDSLELRGAHLVVNGQVLEQRRCAGGVEVDGTRAVVEIDADGLSYGILPGTGTGDSKLEPTVVPPGHVFVLGDNRDNSLDSRQKSFVAIEDILGRAVSIDFSRDPEGRSARWDRYGLLLAPLATEPCATE